MHYTNLCPATNWFHVSLPVAPKNEVIVYPVAVWATDEKGSVVGLISVQCNAEDDGIMGKNIRLVAPPPVPSVYKELRELSKPEQQSFLSSKPVKVVV